MGQNLPWTPLTVTQTGKVAAINAALLVLDNALTEVAVVDFSQSPAPLTAGAVDGVFCINFTGQTAAQSCAVPPVTKATLFRNLGTYDVTLTCGTASLDVVAGGGRFVYQDGSANGLEPVALTISLLAQLLDVDVSTAPADTQLLTYVAATQKWTPKPLPSGYSETTSGAGGAPGSAPSAEGFRYYRLTAQSPSAGNGYNGVSQIVLATASGGAMPSVVNADGTAANAIFTSAGGNDEHHYVTPIVYVLDFTTAQVFVELRVASINGYALEAYTDILIEGSNDNSSFVTVQHVTSTSPGGSAGQLDFPTSSYSTVSKTVELTPLTTGGATGATGSTGATGGTGSTGSTGS